MTALVPAYRERRHLGPKLRSLAALEYPRHLLGVVVISDGDQELAALARSTLPDATVVLLDERRGKPGALNRGLEFADGELVLLTDAHTPLAPLSLASAVGHFADPEVGGVSGRWHEAGRAYDRYEHLIRRLESRSGSTAGVFGGFFLVRRELIEAFPEDVVNDDLWLACRVVAAGRRVIYEPASMSSQPPLAAGAELERRTRIGAGRAMLARELGALPWAFRWRLISHKFGRLALPFLLTGHLAASVSLSRSDPYRKYAALQLAFYVPGLLAAAGIVPPGPAGPPARAAGQFVLGNVGTALGVLRALRGRQEVRWAAVR